MATRLFSRPTHFFRLICLLLCSALAMPFSVFLPRPNFASAGTAHPLGYAKNLKTTQMAQRARWREGELLVRFRQNASFTDTEALLLAQGAQRGGRLRGQSGIERLRLSPGLDPAMVASAFRASRLVDFVEPNYLITADEITPNDPHFPEQWALKKTGTSGEQLNSDINVSQAWGVTTGTRRTIVAVIDSGIDFTHPDLRLNQWNNILEQANGNDDDENGFRDDLHGWDFIVDGNDIRDEQGHGTAVAGVIAAHGNNAIGISGVMWRASLLSLRVLDSDGTGDIAGAVEAIDYAMQNGAQVINCSWGTEDASVALREAIGRASRRGVVVVASAGNGARDLETQPHYPAAYNSTNLISVAATESSDGLAAFSNWGALHVSVAAPGKDILTTRVGGDYQTISGSSFSAAFVTGIVGLIKTLRPWLNAERTRGLILQGVRQVSALAGKVSAGGVIDGAGALNALSALPPNEGREAGNGNNGGDHIDNNGNGRSKRGGNSTGDGNGNDNGQRDGREFSVPPLPPTPGVPGPGLPNMEELRRKQPVSPQVPAPVPPERCPAHNKHCKADELASADLPVDLLAWGLSLPSVESFFGDNSRLISDVPFRLSLSSQPSSSASLLPPPQTTRTNVALASNGGVATASTAYPSSGFAAALVNDGKRKGVWGVDGGWIDNTWGVFPDWVQIEFNGSKSIDEIDVVTLQDNYGSPVEPTEAMTFGSYGVTGFDVQYWDGSAWVNVPGGSITGNNKVWKKLTFSPINTSKIRVLTRAVPDNAWSRVVEVEAYGVAAPSRTNVALASNGGVASASSFYNNSYAAAATNNGDRKGMNWGAGGGWLTSAPNYPAWLEIAFNGSKTIDEIDVFTIQDNYSNPSEPTPQMTFGSYGVNNFEAQYWNGTNWVTVHSGRVTNNNHVWRQLSFLPITTSKIRVYITATTDGYSRLAEVEAWSAAGTNAADFTTPRLDASNRTGTGGVDLLSRNANWSLPIVGLKGRAGLDLGLSLSYNSLVWTKAQNGSSIKFDADQSTPSPGFRLGFPVIQPLSYNPQTGQNSFLLITPSGARVDLRQVGTANVYEAGDSSYLQLIDNGNGNLSLRPTDGSQLTYKFKNGQYYCEEIKDRNGNFISATYYDDGSLNTVTDTLGRTLIFNYVNGGLTSIIESWTSGGQQQTHTWATFGWGNVTMNPGFTNPTIVGPQSSTPVSMLTQVGFPDGTRYNFEYNSYGQVSVIRHYAADNHQLSYTSYTFGPGASDCPRVSESRVWAENWAGQNGVPAEILTQYAEESSGVYTLTAPDGTVYKEMIATSGWQKGLTTGTEIWSGGVKKKWTTTAYTQDDTNLPYQKNPRVTQTNVYDSDNNRKRIAISYGTPGGAYEQWGLVYKVTEYAANATTVLRETYTDYNLGQQYLDRRIIGLVSAVHVSDGAWAIKTGYEYDAAGDQLRATPVNATQHDPAYGTSLTARGNLTSISRYDVTDINNESKKLVTRMGYDTNGSVIFTRDPLGHQSNIGYADAFSDGANRNTFAYPSTATDPDGHSSTFQHNYHFGDVTRTQTPAPAGQAQGAIQTFEYDAAGRISRVNNVNSGAYRRWVYDPYGYVSVFDTFQAGAPEAYSVVVYDGAGRVRATGGDNPNSTGLYRGQFTLYDVMGRASQASNPAEINSGWTPVGDDATGWVWNLQAYDWKGRPTVTTHPDGTSKEALYGGCGCAGGEVVTLRDEVGKRQRVTADILGRAYKAEALNWDGSVYSTIINTYNARDQLINARHYQGTDSSGVYQESIMTHDGYGRLQTSKAPQQTAPTSYSYYADDTINTITDARGATQTFSYNNRHQVMSLTYSAPTGITATAAVSFEYDAAGNRTLMIDGTGSTSYNYDQFSRLSSETRQFAGLASSYTLSYSYNLAGELTNITDPWGAQVGYVYDRTGRMTDVTGSGYANVTNYASNLRYRAWGAMKSMSYGNGMTLAASYNSRLQLQSFEIAGQAAQYGASTVISARYQYQADGRLRSAHDLLDERMDRAYSYDHAGRLQTAYTGAEARDYLNNTGGWAVTGPYRQTYQYDVWGEMTNRTSRFWSQDDWFSASYLNGRNQNAQYQYDAAGNVLQDETLRYKWDAAGRNREVVNRVDGAANRQEHDGLGQVVKQVSSRPGWPASTQYYLRSSVMGGQVVAQVNQNGARSMGYVYAGSEVLAEQVATQSGAQAVRWRHTNPLTGSRGESDQQRVFTKTVEADPMGVNVGTEDPTVNPDPAGFQPDLREPMLGGLSDEGCSHSNPGCRDCFLDGIGIGNCAHAARLLDAGFAEFNPEEPGDASGLPGVIPLYGEFCVTVAAGGRVETECTTEITGYISFGAIANNLNLRQTLPQNPEVPMAAEQITAIRNQLAGLLTDKCAKFIDQLVSSQTGERYDSKNSLLKDFDSIRDGKGGFFWGGNAPGTGGNAEGWLGGGNGKVRLDNNRRFTDPKMAFGAALGALHEIIHIIAVAPDKTLSERVRELGITVYARPGEVLPYPIDKDNSKLAYSGYWGQALINACDPNYGKSVIYLEH